MAGERFPPATDNPPASTSSTTASLLTSCPGIGSPSPDDPPGQLRHHRVCPVARSATMQARVASNDLEDEGQRRGGGGVAALAAVSDEEDGAHGALAQHPQCRQLLRCRCCLLPMRKAKMTADQMRGGQERRRRDRRKRTARKWLPRFLVRCGPDAAEWSELASRTDSIRCGGVGEGGGGVSAGMREEDSNWFARWEEELPTPEELMPLSQSLITPDLALAFDIPTSPTSPSSPTPLPVNPSRRHHHHQPHLSHPSTPPHLLSSLHLHHDSQSLPPSSHQLPPLQPDFDSSEMGNGGGGGTGSVGAPGEEPARTLKRPRLVWTPQLHKRFVDAVAHLGIKNAVPKTIMQLMNVEGLTRENVASHLQKYRLYLKRMQGLSSGGAGAGAGGPVSAADSATDHLFASAPVPHHFLSRGPASGAGIHGGGAGGPEQFMPFVQVAALQHHQQMAAAAAAAAAHQQQQYYHQRHMGHIGSPPGGGFERGYLTRQQQPGIQMMVAPGGTATGPSPPAASYAEDSESGAELPALSFCVRPGVADCRFQLLRQVERQSASLSSRQAVRQSASASSGCSHRVRLVVLSPGGVCEVAAPAWLGVVRISHLCLLHRCIRVLGYIARLLRLESLTVSVKVSYRFKSFLVDFGVSGQSWTPCMSVDEFPRAPVVNIKIGNNYIIS
ncbi:hypothetical protein Taro_033193 [Colocasia esculenta]|uniref:HTH myb-type domain-containing protein n=1 Tax=Colocasia esculenta TaxID=4460 RepID=A0A843W103_COLES|nr:hypothetical protein [Colocasia esculenta]